jgi:hypothetical protein
MIPRSVMPISRSASIRRLLIACRYSRQAPHRARRRNRATGRSRNRPRPRPRFLQHRQRQPLIIARAAAWRSPPHRPSGNPRSPCSGSAPRIEDAAISMCFSLASPAMKAGGAAPSRCRCNSTFGNPAMLTESSFRGVRGGMPRWPRRMLAPAPSAQGRTMAPHRARANPPRAARAPSTGTRSRVCSVPRQVGSLPWSAVKIARSPGASRARRTGAGPHRTIPAPGIARHVAGWP